LRLPAARSADITILNDYGRKFCGPERHTQELCLALKDIEYRKPGACSPHTNAFNERFNGTLL
jgi:hypothetical protein